MKVAGKLLTVRDLRVAVRGTPLLHGVSFDVRPGEVLGLVGESGAGKSLTARAVLGMAPPGATVGGSVRLDGHELIGAAQHEVRALRGRRMAMVPQDALAVLSPVHTVGKQLATAIRSVQGVSRAEARQRAVAGLERVGIADARRRARAYPHEFSGGMRQRAVIAMAMANDPELVIADEPTTALDPTVQATVLDVLTSLRERVGAALVLVTHDLPVVAQRADRVLVLRDGHAVESGPAERVFSAPAEPYTARLLGSLTPKDAAPEPPAPADPLLVVDRLRVRYPGEPSWAVDEVSFGIQAGETLALIGESGCGKSSTASAVLGLRRPHSGQVVFDGRDITTLAEPELRRIRPALQPVFQDPYGSLSPRLRVRDAVAEPLRVQGRWDPDAGPARVRELLDLVGLDHGLAGRLPHELSGGQCQRVGIARALASEPRLLVLDEPVSALDPTVRAGVLDLLASLQRELGLAYLFICHDLALVRGFAHRVAVMRAGRLLETGPAERVCGAPEHPYTRELLAAVPAMAGFGSSGPLNPGLATPAS